MTVLLRSHRGSPVQAMAAGLGKISKLDKANPRLKRTSTVQEGEQLHCARMLLHVHLVQLAGPLENRVLEERASVGQLRHALTTGNHEDACRQPTHAVVLLDDHASELRCTTMGGAIVSSGRTDHCHTKRLGLRRVLLVSFLLDLF